MMQSEDSLMPLTVGPVVFDRARRRVLLDGHIVHLPAAEAAVLEILMTGAGRVLSSVDLAHALGSQCRSPGVAARLARRLRRRLTVSPLQPPIIERVGRSDHRFVPVDFT